MSGHSKFANIKHKKEKNDAAKGKVFTKIGREIAVAVKEGGGADPANNSRLRDAIAKAKDLKNLKKYGKRRIKSELYSKGIDTEYVEEAVSYLEEDEEDMLLPLVEKRLKGNFEKKNIDKCIRYFMYRGYGFSDIKNCIDNIKEEYGE